MSDNSTFGFDPMVPLGTSAATPSAPNRSEFLMPPLPRPTTPVEPRRRHVADGEGARCGDARAAQSNEPPLPGRMAWLPEALRLLVTPTRQKGVIAAGLASLAVGIGVAQWMWPAKPVSTEAMPVDAAPQALASITPPVIVVAPTAETTITLPVPQNLPKLNVAPATFATFDTQVKPAGGYDLPPLPAPGSVPAPTSTPTTTPTPAPMIPTAPALAVPTAPAIAPLAVPPMVAPPIATPPAPAMASPPTADKLPLPVPERFEPMQPPVPRAEPTAMPLPQISIAPPTIVEVKPLTLTPPPAPMTVPSSPAPTEPVFRKEGTTPVTPLPPVVTTTAPPSMPSIAPTAAPPNVLPGIVMPSEPTRPPTPAPALPTIGVKPREDYDVDVHYPAGTDTYTSISKKWLGDERFAEALRAYNGNRNVLANQPVDVPPIFVLRKQYASLITSPKMVSPASGETRNDALPVARSGGLKSYDVPAGGLTLKEIAKKSLGDDNFWGQIWELNPKLRADEPVPAGTRLKLPSDSRIGE